MMIIQHLNILFEAEFYPLVEIWHVNLNFMGNH
jgi:hypothetical protein